MASSGLWIVQILYLRPIPELRLLIKSFLNLNKVCSSQSDKCRLLNRCPEMSISKEASWGRQRLVYRGQTLFYSKNVWGHFQNLHEKICLHRPLVTSIFFSILASKTASKLCLRPFPESAWKNINFDTHNFTLASNGLKRPPWPPVTSIFFLNFGLKNMLMKTVA